MAKYLCLIVLKLIVHVSSRRCGEDPGIAAGKPDGNSYVRNGYRTIRQALRFPERKVDRRHVARGTDASRRCAQCPSSSGSAREGQGKTSALPKFGFAPSLPYFLKNKRKFKFQVFIYLLCF